jgi:integrase/recombinase XerD
MFLCVKKRAKLDAQAEARAQEATQGVPATRKPKGKQNQQRLLSNRRANTTIARAIEDYLQDHAGGNHSDKTLEWHRTALGLMRTYCEQEREITLVGEIDAPDISAWFAHMRTSSGGTWQTSGRTYHPDLCPLRPCFLPLVGAPRDD